MSLPKPITSLLVVLVAASASAAMPSESFSKWLGPQTNENAKPFAPVVGESIDRTKHDKLARYDISLKIVKGAELMLPASENAIVTFDEAGFQQTKAFRSAPEARYLVGKLQLQKNKLGWRFYTLNVRVTDGALKGAVVHLRYDKIQDSITDPCVAVYKIPEDVKIETGNVPFEVVALFAK